MIGIISLGIGNISAIANIYDDLGFEYEILESTENYKNQINKIILPGVSSFDQAMFLMKKKGFDIFLKNFCNNKNNFLLGICLGMQVLGKNSEEGKLEGLSLIPGQVKKFNNINPLPHVGWNFIKIKKNEKLLYGIENKSKFYFLHSFHFIPENKEHIVATSDYFYEFTCIVKYENIIGVQFHPEKSHESGVNLLSNFAKL